MFCHIKNLATFALPKKEYYFFRPVRLGVRTPGFHPGNRGSIPLRATLNHYKPSQIYYLRGFVVLINYNKEIIISY